MTTSRLLICIFTAACLACAAMHAFAQSAGETAPQDLIHRGSGAFVGEPPQITPPATIDAGAPKLDLIFERAPVGVVVQSLLADFTHASVVVDPRVSGEITIRSTGQISAAEIPAFLQTSLAPLGLDLVQQAPNAYLLRPAPTQNEGAPAEVFHAGARTQSGLVIYGLRYVSATEMARLMQPLAPQGVTVQAERSRELLIIAGAPNQVQSLVGTIELLDVDWLAGISFAIAPLQYAEPDQLIGELRALFGGADGPIGSMVEFVPMPGRRAVLILAKRPDRLDQARTWIAQLDRPLSSNGRIRIVQVQNADAEKLAETVARLFATGENATVRITADARRNALLIDCDPSTFEEIANLVRQLDTPVDQVVIEATIAEVELNHDLRFGVQWSFDTRDGGRVTLSEAENGAVAARFPGMSYGYAGNYVQAALNALASRTHVEVISSPVVVTLDNQEATLQVGDEVPVVTQSAASVATADPAIVSTVQYRDTGIMLRVTPRIGADNNVTLEVAQEASEVAANTTSGIDSPTIQQRRFQSTVTIADGQTIALGGLIRAFRSRTRAGVPVLSAVPILGAAFRNTNDTVRRTELVVFLTPRVIRSPSQAETFSNGLAQRLARIRASRFIQRNAQHD